MPPAGAHRTGPRRLMQDLLEIERGHGRVRRRAVARARSILDLLLYGEAVRERGA